MVNFHLSYFNSSFMKFWVNFVFFLKVHAVLPLLGYGDGLVNSLRFSYTYMQDYFAV